MDTAPLPALPLLFDRSLWSSHPLRRRSTLTLVDEVKEEDRVGTERVGFSRSREYCTARGWVSVRGGGKEGRGG